LIKFPNPFIPSCNSPSGVRLIVVGGSASSMFSRELAKGLNCKLADAEIKRFPDEECYIQIKDDLSNQDVIVVQTSYPDPNIIELFLLQDAIYEFGPTQITTIIPYFGYGRQDKKFLDGEAISARAMAKHIGLLSDKVYTIDIHNTSVLGEFSVEVENLSAMGAIGKFLKENNVDAILSPDAGSKDRAEIAAKSAGCGWDFLEKKRLDDETVEMTPKSLDVNGKIVAIVDDIIATGGTVITAAGQLKEQGATKVIAACTHGLFTSGAMDRLNNACDLVVSTDTIERETSTISAAHAVVDVLTS